MKTMTFTTPSDPSTAPITGWTRRHWEEAMFFLMQGVLNSASPGNARQRIPGPRSHHGQLADGDTSWHSDPVPQLAFSFTEL